MFWQDVNMNAHVFTDLLDLLIQRHLITTKSPSASHHNVVICLQHFLKITSMIIYYHKSRAEKFTFTQVLYVTKCSKYF